jgi:hypothetical protein
MQRVALRGVMLRRTGTPVISGNASRNKPGSRLCGAPLRKSYALHRVRDTRVTNMPQPPSAYDVHQRQRWTRHDAHLWIRHDAARFLPPGTDPADVFPTLKQQREAAEDAAFAAKIAASRRFLAELRVEVDELKAALARRLLEEAKYSPSQPRVPAGNPRGGQWTDRSGGQSQDQNQGTGLAQPMGNVDIGDVSGSSELGDLFQITPDETRVDGVRLAANDTPDDPAPVRDPAPKIPLDRPETSSERTSYLRSAANWFARNAGLAGDIYTGAMNNVEWLRDYHDVVQASRDGPKSLEELQQAVDDPKPVMTFTTSSNRPRPNDLDLREARPNIPRTLSVFRDCSIIGSPDGTRRETRNLMAFRPEHTFRTKTGTSDIAWASKPSRNSKC